MPEQANNIKTPSVISPRFTNVARKPNPDGTMDSTPHATGNATPTVVSPGLQCSASPTASATKSIMNASGTSGAVVSNTPEPGLKRVPTVTFSDSKHFALKQAAANAAAAAAQQARLSNGEETDKSTNSSPKSKVTSPTMQAMSNLRGPSPPPILHTDASLKEPANRPASQNSVSSAEHKKPNLISKILHHSADILHHGDHSSTISPTVSTLEKHEDDKEEHPHFFVDDVLHSPEFRSRSNSGTPSMPQMSITEKQEAVKQEPMIVENLTEKSVVEFPITSQQIAPNIPKRESGKNSDPRLPQDDGKLHVLFGATGSLSVLKIKSMIKKLEEIYGRDKISIQVILTQSAAQFFANRTKKIKPSASDLKLNSETSNAANNTAAPSGTSVGSTSTEQHSPKQPTAGVTGTQVTPFNGTAAKIELPPHIQVWTDQDEWDVWKQRTDPVLHIELRRWADILVVAPLTANTLSKIALGLCDNLLTSVIRAWNPMFPIFLAPSMVSCSYNSAITKRHLNLIKEEMPWITVFKPSEKIMGINGDIGLGGMMDGNEIVDKVVMKLGGYPEDEDEEDDDEDDEDEDDDEEDEEDNSEKGKKENDTLLDEDDEEDDDEDDDEEDDDEDEQEEQEVVPISNSMRKLSV